MTQIFPCLLYLITPPKFEITSFVESFKRACSGGKIGALQLRLKEDDTETPADDNLILKAAETLMPICREHDITFIINDRPELVKKVGADGVHVGQNEETVKQGNIKNIRKLLGEDYIIGASCYASRDLAMAAGEHGADYVSFGAFYHTTTKKPKGYPEPEILSWWSENTVLPSCAIGGIKPDNCAPLVKAGADFICVVTGVWDYPQGPEKAVADFNRAILEAQQS